MKKLLQILLLTAIGIHLAAQDTTQIEAVTITGKKIELEVPGQARYITTITREEIEKMPVSSIDQMLDFVLGLDIRQRGSDNTQADISIRGSSTDQVLILIDGINFSDFQTGHHSLNIPLSLDDVEKIEILEGASARLFGTNSFAGVINIITKPEDQNDARIKLGIGQYGYQHFSSKINLSGKKISSSISAGYKRSFGYYTNTDFELSHAFYSGSMKLSQHSQISLSAGYWGKNFGAYNFYTPTFPYQYEKIKGGLGVLSYKYSTSKLKIKASAYFRRQDEIFELFREGSNWYIPMNGYFIRNITDTAKFYPGIYEDWNYYRHHNFHQSNLSGFLLTMKKSVGKGQIYAGAEVRNEAILSNVLGEEATPREVSFYSGAYFDKYAGRTNTNLFVNYLHVLGRFTLSAGNMTTYSTQYGLHYYFGGDLSYAIKKGKIYMAINQSMREPTFTDLYYSGPANIGNPDLLPERAITYETGLKKIGTFSVQTAIFYRRGRDIIDWVRANPTDKWQTMNYTKLDTYGAELALAKQFNGTIKSIFLSYKYTDQVKPPADLLSKYVLDYMRHNLSLSVNGHLSVINWTINTVYSDRNGSFELYTEGQWTEQEYLPYLLLNAKLWFSKEKTTLYIQANNLANVEYYDISNVKLPGRWLRAGVEIAF